MIIDSRYKVIEELGTGIWSTTYKVKDLRTNKVYALKLFQNIESEELYEKFSAEDMHHITKIQHPNLLHVRDFGNFGTHIYYLSDFYDGYSFSDFKVKSSNMELLYDIVVQICYALNALHSQKIVHKGLRPTSILYKTFNNKTEVKVTDFGFTRVEFDVSQQKLSKTLPYIAPEIYMGKKSLLQSDFYSLGVILYKLTTGSLPYSIDQISDFMAGKEINLFPKFPRELNNEIPLGLERLILKLLEKNPKDRFSDVSGIIAFINQIQLKKYSFSRRWSIVHNIEFSDYLVREDYSHKLLDYVPLIEDANGKLISMIAGKGLGKNNVLTLFKYHLLTDKYFIFDYLCGPNHKDPFFALIKEFYNYVENNDELISDLSNISEKLKKYLFESEEVATFMDETEEDLSRDFETTANFLFHLSREKPIVFVIRSAQFLAKEVIEFLNFISQDIMKKRILIILSINDPRKLEGLIHPVQIKIEPLNLKQTQNYVERLVHQTVPNFFVNQLWKRCFGNPLFIEKFLIELTQAKVIWNDNKYDFDVDLEDFELPEEVVHSIYDRMSHLQEKTYKRLQKIAALFTPFSKELMKSILQIKDKEAFFLINDGLNNEIIKAGKNYFTFTFKEAKERLWLEISEEERKSVSRKVLKYFDDKNVTRLDFLKGIIKHANFIQDFVALRKYTLRLSDYYADRKEHEASFEQLCIAVEIDFAEEDSVSRVQVHRDLLQLIQKSEWTTPNRIPEELKNFIVRMPDIAEKHLLIGIFYMELEKFQLAQQRLQKAYKLAITGFFTILSLIKLARNYFSLNNYEKMDECLQKIEKYELTPNLEIQAVGVRALYLGSQNRPNDAIKLIENYLPQIKAQNNDYFFVKLGELHNFLALMYHRQRMLDEAHENFQIACNIWENQHYNKKLGTIYNNIGDVALMRGDTNTALKYFDKALRLVKKNDIKSGIVQGFLNHGEAYVKLGEFQKAEDYLLQALDLCNSLEIKPFYKSIINNLAIAKSRIKNLAYYHNFIKKHEPQLIKGKIEKINPLVKTYFYYLINIGDYSKISELLEKSKQIILDKKEDEFYFQMKGYLLLNKGKYKQALQIIERAFKYSQRNQSVYAQVINYIRLLESYFGMQNTENAVDIYQKAEQLSSQNNFYYWRKVLKLRKVKIDLMDPSISLRKLVRTLLDMLEVIKKRELYFLELDIYELLVQIYGKLNVKRKAQLFFKKYKTKIEEVAEGLPQRDKDMFFRKSNFHVESYKELQTVNIAERFKEELEKWQEEIYDILKIKESGRIKFFIDRKINSLFSPYYYAIILKEEIYNKLKPFLLNNVKQATLYQEKFYTNILSSLERNEVISRKLNGSHVLFAPLRIKTTQVGCLILADRGELVFQEEEKDLIRILRLHLTSLLLRIDEFSTLNRRMQLMNKLIGINEKFFSILDISKLEQEIVLFTLDFINATRGFLIKKDEFENYRFTVALDEAKHILNNYAYISKSLVSEVQKNKQPIYLKNASQDELFEGYIDAKKQRLSVYCAPIIVDGNIHGFLYLDNHGSQDELLNINQEFMRLLLIQISVAIKNANQYEVLRRKNMEINSLNNLKTEFINIVSHELKTPLVSLQGYVKRLRKKPEDQTKLLDTVEDNVVRLHDTTQNIINFNKYRMASELRVSTVNIGDLLNTVIDDIKDKSAYRHMRYKLEVDKQLPPVKLNWQAFDLLVRNLINNSIRFTNDFGTITVGARRSAFQKEKVNNKDSLVVYVEDNGIGIPEGELKNVFQKFYELSDIYAHSSGKYEYRSSGLGLGLSTCEIIAELHHGKIWINSKEAEGTTVFVAVPLEED
jgi:signal transduction histidine kinase/serine/threonine protein kinase/tetratricopeptide (TPR) repeat protein